MSMKTIMTAALAMPITLLAVENAYWNPEGSGPWWGGARWKENDAPTSKAFIEDAEGYATDGDFEFMTNINIRLSGTAASLDLRFDEDHKGHFKTLQLVNRTSTTLATVYKSGTGTLHYDNGGNGFIFPNFFVTNGILKLTGYDTQVTNMVYGSFAPGQLIFQRNADLYVKGLVGDGPISSGYGRQVALWGDIFHNWADMTPFVYSGTLGANMNLIVRAGRHHFTGLTTEDLAIQINGGELGVSTLGMTGVSGSVGRSQQLNFRGNGTLLYLGSGEDTDKIPFFGVDCETATVDAGARGGVRFTASWNGNAARDRTIVLTGSNTTDCVIAADILATNICRTTLVKRGSGTWDLSDYARAKVTGPIMVEEGTLKVATLAPTNVACAIGLSANLGESAAIVLGSSGKTGTLEYTGADTYSRAEGRTIAVTGTGRLYSSATTGAVNYFGVTANDAQGGTLVLDGTGAHDGVNDISGVSIEKTGAGTWSIGGSVDVAKTDIKQGALILNNFASRYRYYRFIVTELWGNKSLQIREFGLYDASGNQVNARLAENASDGKPYDLSDGQIQFGMPFTMDSRFTLSNLVDGVDTQLYGWGSNKPTKGDPNTWYVFTMKLPEGAQPVRYYDIKASMGYDAGKPTGPDDINWNENHMCNFEARGWRVEASTDGRQWDLLDEKYLNGPNVSAGNRWYSCNSGSHDSSHLGFDLEAKGTATPPARIVSLGTVSVAGGAELLADAPEIGRAHV